MRSYCSVPPSFRLGMQIVSLHYPSYIVTRLLDHRCRSATSEFKTCIAHLCTT